MSIEAFRGTSSNDSEQEVAMLEGLALQLDCTGCVSVQSLHAGHLADSSPLKSSRLTQSVEHTSPASSVINGTV